MSGPGYAPGSLNYSPLQLAYAASAYTMMTGVCYITQRGTPLNPDVLILIAT